MSRGAIKAQLSDNEGFGLYLEQEPYVRELVDAFMGSKFKTVLEMLESYSVSSCLALISVKGTTFNKRTLIYCNKTRHALDPHLAPHVRNLTSMIRDRALVLYFQPFASIELPKMAAAFGLTLEEVEKLVVGLIQSGHIRGRIDSRRKVRQTAH